MPQPDVLSASQLRAFAEDGYVAVPGLLSRAQSAAMRCELDRFVAEGRFWDVSLKPVADSGLSNLHLGGVGRISPLYRALAFAPRVVAAARALVGDPLAFQMDQIFLKPARNGRGTGWHQDNAYFSYADPTKGVGVWMPLGDATRENGTMHVIPGSHRHAVPHRLAEDTAYLKLATDVEETEAVAIELAAGGALFFNNGILHCTKDNRSERARAAFAMHFVNADHVPAGFFDDPGHVRLTGPGATGGLAEYGARIEGTFESEVERVLTRTFDGRRSAVDVPARDHDPAAPACVAVGPDIR